MKRLIQEQKQIEKELEKSQKKEKNEQCYKKWLVKSMPKINCNQELKKVPDRNKSLVFNEKQTDLSKKKIKSKSVKPKEETKLKISVVNTIIEEDEKSDSVREDDSDLMEEISHDEKLLEEKFKKTLENILKSKMGNKQEDRK